ncbi:response regulator transcription factor [Pendulispora brunnea]|uniref:Response regulator transcription factor n=1 Tax=Pendulispora brunnea TaxID=2905690 RepID=A0ABZ2JYV0_9BACT
MARILIVEDDAPIAILLADHLRKVGHVVRIVGNGLEAIALYRAERADLVILDVMIPGANGYDVCRALRAEQGRQPIVLMLTARVTEEDAILGYKVGADDYVRKPFGVRELLARIKALLRFERRDHDSQKLRAEDDAEALTVGQLRLDPAGRHAQIGARAVDLTPMEFDMLICFARRAGEVLSREQLLSDVWGYTDSSYALTVDSHVTRVRRKLASAGLAPEVIGTVPGVGYVLSLDALGTSAPPASQKQA